MTVTADTLEPVVRDAPDLVSEALSVIYSGHERKVTLASLQAMAAVPGGMPLSELLLITLKGHDMLPRFLSALAQRGRDLGGAGVNGSSDARIRGDFLGAAMDQLAGDDFDIEALPGFVRRAERFRCRVKVNGQTMGSGAFVSSRLVLTAAHVVEKEDGCGAAGRLSVMNADGEEIPARLLWSQSCHPQERTGQLPPPDAIDGFADAALLFTYRNMGQWFEHFPLREQKPVDWTGSEMVILLHFPDGQDHGLSFGVLERNGPDDLRQLYSQLSKGGSSGGAGFDRKFNYLGLHQGKWQNLARLVPFERFSADGEFRSGLDGDRPPPSLWSLDGTPDGHIIIGRDRFFEGVISMVDGSVPNLRGIWIKRKDTSRTEGLDFSFRMLNAFLIAQNVAFQPERVPMGYDTPDVIAQIEQQVFGGDAGMGRGGVRRSETSVAAHDEDRARQLADRLQAKAERDERSIWFYFENPPSGLLRKTQVQFEQLVDELMARPNLRLVLAGFETYDLTRAQFDALDKARRAGTPSLLVEYLGSFTRSDVVSVAREMSRSLALDWSDSVLERLVRNSLFGIPAIGGNHYAMESLQQVAEHLRREAQLDLEVMQ